MSRSLLDLDDDVRAMALAHAEACAAEHIVIVFTQTFRTAAEQQALYDRGRSIPGPRVTNAKPGYSWHEFRRAYDVAIKSWGGDQTPKDLYDGPWDRVGELGEMAGMEWGGHWKRPDYPHFDHHGGKTLAQRRAEREALA